jgi:ubiquinone biosynthesis protein COQ9
MSKTAKSLDEKKVFRTTFATVAERGLAKTRLSALARDLKIPLKNMHAHYGTVDGIIAAFLDHVDGEMVKNVSAGTVKRDLYFDMMMARFDALQPYRDGVVRALKDVGQHPLLLATLLARWNRSLSLMLDIAGDSPVYPVKKIGLAGVYLAALKAWVGDDSPDMAKTMAALDRALAKAGSVVERFLKPNKTNKK